MMASPQLVRVATCRATVRPSLAPATASGTAGLGVADLSDVREHAPDTTYFPGAVDPEFG
jgi:hypothetical protein